jgi:thiol-disulfide isomerase/thioredoxin
MARKKNNYLIWIISGLVLLVFVGLYFNKQSSSSLNKDTSYLDGFAQCLEESGAIFYGAFWCPHCEDQKEAFGSAFQYVNHVECSTADGRGQLPICQQAEIESYPTWFFADDSREYGNLPFEVLAEKTGCVLPQV